MENEMWRPLGHLEIQSDNERTDRKQNRARRKASPVHNPHSNSAKQQPLLIQNSKKSGGM